MMNTDLFGNIIEEEQQEFTGESSFLFPDLIGQERITEVLTRVYKSGRLPHAMLFTGEEGVGKEAAAIDFARIMLCEGKSPQIPCEKCASCKQSKQLKHPNLRIIFPLPKPKESSDSADSAAGEAYTALQQKKIDGVLKAKLENPYSPLEVAGGNEILLEHIHTLHHEFSMTSYSGDWRFVIISQADRLRVQAANAFLKLLEEPPKGSVFILTSSRPTKILPTIMSRCQNFRFPFLSFDLIQKELQSRHNIAPEKAALAARLSGGSWWTALEWAEGDPGKKMEKVVNILRTLLKGDPGQIDEMVDNLTSAANSAELPVILELMSSWLRDVQRFGAAPEMYKELGYDNALVNFTKFCGGRDIALAIDKVEEARVNLRMYVQPPLILHKMFLDICNILFNRRT